MNSETKKLCGEILQKLLKKYDQRSAKQVDTKRRITLRPSEIYKAYAANNADIRQKETINEAVHQLESKQLVTVKRLKYSDEIEKIYMSEDSVSSAQDFFAKPMRDHPSRSDQRRSFPAFRGLRTWRCPRACLLCITAAASE